MRAGRASGRARVALSSRRRAALTLAAFLALTSVFACRAHGPRLVHESDSQFNHLVVREESDGARTLQFGREGVIQSRVNLDDPMDLKLQYTRAAMLAWALVPAPRRVLIIGLGGGAMPRYLHRVLPKAHIDVAELDPAVHRVAREYFGLPDDDRLQVHVGDGRAYVHGAAEQWDLIVLDAYGDSDIPRHLATAEFLTDVKAHLAEHGVVSGNVWSRDSNVLYDAMARTWVEAFGPLCIVPIEGSSNRIFLAAKGADVSAAAIRGAAAKLPAGFEIQAYAPQECLADIAADAQPLHDP
jgi:spermidine synthase